MRILFLHGWHSVPGGVKPTSLVEGGHEVVNPALDDDDFAAAVATARQALQETPPDVIVGSSRGGAVALNLGAYGIPLVLICPAWKRWGAACVAPPGTTILHSRQDDVVPFADSEELVRVSGLPAAALVEVGTDHRLADPASLAALRAACESAAPLAGPRASSPGAD